MNSRAGKGNSKDSFIPDRTSFRDAPIKIISVFSFKGGVGKTTLCANLAAMIASANVRVLAIDGDPQGNLTSFFMEECVSDEKDMTGSSNGDDDEVEEPQNPRLLKGSGTKDQKIIESKAVAGMNFIELLTAASKNLDTHQPESPVQTVCPYRRLGLISGSPRQPDKTYLSFTNDVSSIESYSRVRDTILKICEKHSYEIVLLDLPPSNSALNKLLITSSDYLLMPVQPDAFSGDTISQIFDQDGSGTDGDLTRRLMSQLYDVMHDIKSKEMRYRHELVFNDCLKILPLVLNRVPKNKKYGTMNVEAEKWSNGMETFMKGATLDNFDSYLQFQKLESFGDRRVLPLFNDAPTAYHASQLLRLPLQNVYSKKTGYYSEFEVESYRYLANAILTLATIRRDRKEPIPASGRWFGELVKKGEMQPYLLPAEQSPMDECVLQLIEELSENKNYRQFIFSPEASRASEEAVCRKIVEIAPELPSCNGLPAITFHPKKGVDLEISCWEGPHVFMEVKYKKRSKPLSLKMPATGSQGGVSQMVECYNDNHRNVYGLVLQQKDHDDNPTGLAMCVSKLATTGDKATKDDHKFFAGMCCWNPNVDCPSPVDDEGRLSDDDDDDGKNEDEGDDAAGTSTKKREAESEDSPQAKKNKL